jgi:hypothetical protein
VKPKTWVLAGAAVLRVTPGSGGPDPSSPEFQQACQDLAPGGLGGAP